MTMAACSNSGSSSDSGSSDSGSSSTGEDVSVFYYTNNDVYINSVQAAMNKDFEDAGIKYHNYDSNNSQTQQTEQVQTAISKGTKCLVVNLVDSSSNDAASAILKMGQDAGIPVVFFNRSVDESVITAYDKSAYIGTDYQQAGQMQGEMIGDYLLENFDKTDLNGDGKISYVMFKGDEANMEAIARTELSVEGANKALTEAGKPELDYFDSKATTKYQVDQNGAWSAQAATDYMQTNLSQYNQANNNMIELVIANNDEMAIGAISALQNAGMNNAGDSVIIPVFGVDATDSAVSKISEGVMVGTVKQDAEGMAKAIVTVVQNLMDGKDKFDGLDSANVVGTWRINIPYSKYSGE